MAALAHAEGPVAVAAAADADDGAEDEGDLRLSNITVVNTQSPLQQQRPRRERAHPQRQPVRRNILRKFHSNLTHGGKEAHPRQQRKGATNSSSTCGGGADVRLRNVTVHFSAHILTPQPTSPHHELELELERELELELIPVQFTPHAPAAQRELELELELELDTPPCAYHQDLELEPEVELELDHPPIRGRLDNLELEPEFELELQPFPRPCCAYLQGLELEPELELELDHPSADVNSISNPNPNPNSNSNLNPNCSPHPGHSLNFLTSFAVP